MMMFIADILLPPHPSFSPTSCSAPSYNELRTFSTACTVCLLSFRFLPGRPFSLVPFLYLANSYSSPMCLPGLFQEAFLDLPRLSRWPPCVLPEQPVLGGLYNDRRITALCKQWPLLLLFLDGTYHSELETVHALPGPRPLLCLYHLPYCRAYNKCLINICWNNKNLSYTTR